MKKKNLPKPLSPKTIVINVMVVFAAIVGLAFIFTWGQKPEPAVLSYTSQDSDRPKAEVPETFFDLGEIAVSDVKQQDYSLKNTGTKPLQILNVNTSCGCTAGQIIYNGTTSKEYSMHSQGGGYVTDIAPGDNATVRLIYRPAVMPVLGLVEREVYVSTNDPDHEKLVFSIKVKVQ